MGHHFLALSLFFGLDYVFLIRDLWVRIKLSKMGRIEGWRLLINNKDEEKAWSRTQEFRVSKSKLSKGYWGRREAERRRRAKELSHSSSKDISSVSVPREEIISQDQFILHPKQGNPGFWTWLRFLIRKGVPSGRELLLSWRRISISKICLKVLEAPALRRMHRALVDAHYKVPLCNALLEVERHFLYARRLE